MKLLLSCLILVVLSGSCKTAEPSVSNTDAKTPTAKMPKPLTKPDMMGSTSATVITYELSSRTQYMYISISEAEILVSEDRGLQNVDSYTNIKANWDSLMRLLDPIDVQTLPDLVAPTDRRLHDGAAHAILGVIRGDMEIRSAPFDHGHPPKAIEALVTKVLSIKESVSKP